MVATGVTDLHLEKQTACQLSKVLFHALLCSCVEGFSSEILSICTKSKHGKRFLCTNLMHSWII
ncbi:hypothetical protein GZ77_18935 [Endozoicomonas montiporae]|uniref:Uncharacterized protein n=2 Tax=Endozoicomonas montiporae TaxID=1027273 RepID=A0A081N2A9_9GAMM|nr:hypothetical protein EZMO1_4544 [Endozoicomonas montiporae CL-33]KEQ12582.1 hypothetical protein GZ77_18935 [Endozoicomonas montiporae]